MNMLTLLDSHFLDDLKYKNDERVTLTGDHLTGYKLLIKKNPDIVIYLRLDSAPGSRNMVNIQFTWYTGNLRHVFRFSEKAADASCSFSSYEIIYPFLEYLRFEFLDYDANRNLGLDSSTIADLMEYVKTARKLDDMFSQMAQDIDADATIPTQKLSLSQMPGFEAVLASFRKLIRNT